MTKKELLELVERTDARTMSRIIEKGGKFNEMKEELETKASETWTRRAKDKFKTRFYSIFIAVIATSLLLASLVGCPQYGVYKSGLQGEAELARAEQNKKIQIENAKGQLASAKMLAESDSIRAIGSKNVEKIRAEGMAAAMEIENGKLTDKYIQYLWVRNIDKGDKIYISTEAGLPILEAK